jgi:prepilin-type N-terminal cleavage/methylation domain-containing protein
VTGPGARRAGAVRVKAAAVRGRRRARRHPGGFTLIELMIAIMILAIGILGMAGTAAVVMKQIGGGAQMTAAAQVAAGRIEWMHTVPCTTLRDSNAVTRGIREYWSVTDTARGKIVVDSVRYYSRNAFGYKSQTYRTVIPCAP